MNYYIKEEKKSNPKRDALLSVFVFLGVFLLVFLVASVTDKNPEDLSASMVQVENLEEEKDANEEGYETEVGEEKEIEDVFVEENNVGVKEEKNETEESSEKVSYQEVPAELREEKKEIGQAEIKKEEDRTKEEKELSYYTQKAQRGDGLTHISRRIILAYNNSNNLDLSPEQIVYAEDYLQRRLQEERGSDSVLLDEEVSASHQLVEDAVEQTSNLTAEQIINLKQFTSTHQL